MFISLLYQIYFVGDCRYFSVLVNPCFHFSIFYASHWHCYWHHCSAVFFAMPQGFFWTSATPVLKDLAKLFLRHSSNIQPKEQLLQPLYFLKYELKSRLTLFSYSFLVSLFSSIYLMNKSPLSVIFHLLASQINGFCWVINSSLSKAFISFKTFFGHSLLPNSNFQFLMDLTDKWLYDYPLLEVYCCCC